ncbi:somatostatin receptor type 2-like [Mercenaria mercenaria]|uniref:somatostatin receptor type 2-like n=1 Tax=Mercenaria mercenaria TaxID=6596 RepID=UPI001E1DC829|nr:somatostatin receptor type 2-like [Mercenaria mercenaria]
MNSTTQMKAVETPLLRNNSFFIHKSENESSGSLELETEVNLQYHLARMIETYFVPIMCSVGIISNILAIKTFLHKGLRNYSCSRYLIAKCVSDTMFLLNLFVIYISHSLKYDLNTANNICQFVIFITYVSGFVSVWTVLLVTMENYIRIRLPFEVKRLCTTRNANIVIFLLVLAAVCIYNFALWISDKNCNPRPEYSTVTQAFIYIDTLLTLIIPSILLTVLIIAILTTFLRSDRKQFNTTEVSTRLVNASIARKSKSKVAVVTKLLLSVSLTFFLLTVTSHVVRIKLLISSVVSGKLELSNTEAAIQRIAQLFFYLSMAVNLFIFLTFGDNFRKVFKKTFLTWTSDRLKQSADDISRRTDVSRSRVTPDENEMSTLEHKSADRLEPGETYL